MFTKLLDWIKGIFQREDVKKAIDDAGDKLKEAAADKIKDVAEEVKSKASEK